MKTNIKIIKEQAQALKEVLDTYNSYKELHKEALGPHFEESIFNNWFTQQIIKGGN